jgi:hypothetical protein
VSSDGNPGLVPVRVVPDAWPSSLNDAGGMNGRMEIVLHSSRRIIVDAGVDAAALARVIGESPLPGAMTVGAIDVDVGLDAEDAGEIGEEAVGKCHERPE